MKVFITGATGLVGGSVARALVAAGHDVAGLTSRPGNEARVTALGARAVVGDMLDVSPYRDEVASAGVVVHAAAAIADKARFSKRDVDRMTDIDERATTALVSALGAGCRAFLFTSGAWVYGDTGPTPVDETHSTDGAYAISRPRARLEHQLLERAKSGGAPCIVMRPGMIYGTSSLWDKLCLAAMKQKRRATMPGSGTNVLSFVHEDDVGAAYLTVAERPAPGEVYNVADDEPAPLRDVMRAQAVALDAPPPRAVPGWLMRLVAGGYTAPPLLGDCVLANDKLKALGFRCRYPDYRSGVTAVARAVRERS